ncbi:CHC2 zinc finger domain-containing protein [Streptomyces sp. NPDC046853]|uniref:CHC2 zinc finger domain-containing protein n=1 Tax=Streptomyces sp. NPDC046853 TaxID=3154920 RepID=UPI0033CC714B
MSRPRRAVAKPPIAAVLKHYYSIDVKERAGWSKTLCPLHVEENPSASVSTEKNRWNCFVCQVTEDSLDVIMREESIGFREAQAWAHARFGGSGENVLPPVPGQSSPGVHQGSRPGKRGRTIHSGIRRFGSDWA